MNLFIPYLFVLLPYFTLDVTLDVAWDVAWDVMSDFTSDFMLLVPAVQPRAVFAVSIADFGVGIVKDLFIQY